MFNYTISNNHGECADETSRYLTRYTVLSRYCQSMGINRSHY